MYEKGYMIADIHLYVCDPKKFEWHFSNRLIFSNTRSRVLVESN